LTAKLNWIHDLQREVQAESSQGPRTLSMVDPPRRLSFFGHLFCFVRQTNSDYSFSSLARGSVESTRLMCTLA
jgi:hypothetical protein